MNRWKFPIKNHILWPDHKGSFGAIRKYDNHTGVDLYCKPGTKVYAVEAGKIIAIEDFTGPKAGYSWWYNTKAVLIEGKSGVVCYGEITPDKMIKVGKKLKQGGYIGKVKKVLKEGKGRPTSMLHVEWYTHGTTQTTLWHKHTTPGNLLNPTSKLLAAYGITRPNIYDEEEDRRDKEENG